MAFGTTPAGTITKEQTTLSIRRLPMTAATTITKGNVVEVNAAGTAIVAPVGQTVKVNHFVALETVVNAGAAGALMQISRQSYVQPQMLLRYSW